jgi:hypothetical protein
VSAAGANVAAWHLGAGSWGSALSWAALFRGQRSFVGSALSWAALFRGQRFFVGQRS